MAEIPTQVRYLKDNDDEIYVPMTHVDCVIGLEELVEGLEGGTTDNQSSINQLKIRVNSIETNVSNQFENISTSLTEVQQSNSDMQGTLLAINETLLTISTDITQMKSDIEDLKNSPTEPPTDTEPPIEEGE
ncbi:hypothetical protein ACO1GT_00290 [Staphylococcus arlettae]